MSRRRPPLSEWPILLLAPVILTSLFSAPALAASPWRFWTKADGLQQSVVFSLSADSTGRILTNFSNSPINWMDGYQITDLVRPQLYGRLHVSQDDKELWGFDGKGVVVHDSSGWHEYPDSDIEEFAKKSSILRTSAVLYASYRGAEDRAEVASFGAGAAVILLPDQIFEWNRVTGRKRLIRAASQTGLTRFRDIQQLRDGGILVTGLKGFAYLKRTHDAFEWHEFLAPPQWVDLVNPIEGRGAEVFVAALRQNGKRSLLRFKDGNWEKVFDGSNAQLRGWRGPDGDIWVQNGRRILQLAGVPLRDLGGGNDITGLPTGVISQADGSFWIGTTEGAARYTPPLWRMPSELAEAPGADTLVSAIQEDAKGRIWFLSGQHLIVNDHGKWSRFQLPPGPGAALLMEKIVVLENGDLVMRAGSLADIVVFNPASGKFRLVPHPDGKSIGWIEKRRGGAIWVQVLERDAVHWSLEVFDGSEFTSGGNPQMSGEADLKAILETRNGDIWLGSHGALGRIRAGKFQIFGKPEGFTDSGVLSAIETTAGKIILGGRESVTEFDGKTFRVLGKAETIESMTWGSDGTLWTASGSGTHRYRSGQWITNTAEDGLPSNGVRKIYSDSRGRVWAGTSRGVSLFHPEADPDPPRTRIIEDRNLRETPPGGEVRLAFSGNDKWKFTAPDRLAFSWRMDGAAWSDFDPSQFASFRGLHSGSHRFEVRAMDRNGNIDPFPAAYQFSVLLPWYLQKLFLLFAAFSMLLIFCLSRMALLHHRRLAFQSGHDSLTGLANRTVFELKFRQAIAASRSQKTGVAMILVDLDHFKPINDTLGHRTGDLYLQEVSARLRSAVRNQDTIARMGGDEFAILMPSIGNRSEAETVARQVLDALRQPYHIESYELTGSASAGVSLFPEHGDDEITLYRLADMAMYTCKTQNKDSYAVFEPDANRPDLRSAQMAGLIRDALDNGHFEIWYQPLRAIDGELTGMEALVRMRHPRLGLIPPLDFISVAEDTGLIVRLGDWVLREACRQTVQWRASGHQIRIGVNVSAIQLAKANFAEKARSVLYETGLDPHALTLEITETAMMHDITVSRSQIEQLRSVGVKIALDDFGTGYSTLSSLELLPLDYIKIDRSFTQRIGSGANGLTVIRKIVELGHECGVEVVAEGVELPEQLDGLRSAGCDGLQGFLLGTPASAELTQTKFESNSFSLDLERMSRAVQEQLILSLGHRQYESVDLSVDNFLAHVGSPERLL